jgi:hypothetical protein
MRDAVDGRLLPRIPIEKKEDGFGEGKSGLALEHVWPTIRGKKSLMTGELSRLRLQTSKVVGANDKNYRHRVILA